MATVGFIHVPKCAGKAIHNTLSCGSNGFINLGPALHIVTLDGE